MADPTPVVVDTDVWSVLFARSKNPNPRQAAWRAALLGQELAIATQTRAEVLAGALRRDLGDQRLAGLRDQLDRTATLPVDVELVDVYASLTADLVTAGHPLHQKQHTGDR